MSADIVDLQRYRERKKKAEKPPRRRSTDRQPGDEAVADPLPDEHLDDDDGTRGGEPA